MFYRRKILLALMEILGGKVDKISFQKLLFLFSKNQEKAVYDFIPYQFGCYSFSANADLTVMVRKGILAETLSHFSKVESKSHFEELKKTDKQLLQHIKNQFGDLNAENLMRFTYLNFPYWAINSIKASSILTIDQLKKIEDYKPNCKKTILYTIGYEGISLEEYLNRLISNNIHLLVDVRNNPISMKFGFSKSSLKRFCSNLGIDYVHFPEVGIRSDKRKQLKTQEDYDNLFKDYCLNNLNKTKSTQESIFKLLQSHERIALTCFEVNFCQCHRKYLTESIRKLPSFDYEIIHL